MTMQISKILVPVDFSTPTRAAVQMATSLAKDHGASLLLLHVEEPPLAYGGGELYYGVDAPDVDALRKMLEEVKPTDPNVFCTRRLVTGDPAAAIVRVAEEDSADLIVMSTHGRTGVTRFLMGSVAEEVVRKATCPVLTLKHVVAKAASPVATEALPAKPVAVGPATP
jgi:nucleotide-binding universal stress UspA family protein